MTVMKRLLLIYMLLYPSIEIQAQEFHNALSFESYTGLLNTPNACVTDQGKFYSVFTNQVEPSRRETHDRAENYLISIGLLPFIETGIRLTNENFPEGIRDLSVNAKIQLPISLFYKNPYLPEIAIGVTDIGGGATHFQTKYGVITKEINPFRFSIGYGNGPDRLKGVFGGAEFRMFDWCYLIGEYDTEETNVGLRLVTPDLFGIPVNLGLTSKLSLDHKPNNIDLEFMLQFPLDFGMNKSKAITEEKNDKVTNKKVLSDRKIEVIPSVRQEPDKDSCEELENALKKIKGKLRDLGFENLAVGVKDNIILYIAYENNRYNHNELDGLGLVLGVAATMAPPILESFIVVIKEVNTPMLEVNGPVSACKTFLTASKASSLDMKAFSDKIVITRNTTSSENEKIRLIAGNDNPSHFKPRLSVYPGLITHIGTEVGLLDYMISLKPDMQVPLWKGGVLQAVWDIPVIWSNEFDADKTFGYQSRETQMEKLMLHQSFKLHPDVMTLFSGGLYRQEMGLSYETTGVFNEIVWTPGSGSHRFKSRLGYFRDNSHDYNRNIYLGSYRYYFDKLDLFMEATYGQYWQQDRGVTLEMKRFFGDTSISLFYQHTNDSAAGIMISLPLTPRRDMKPDYFQLKGSDRWSYSIRSSIAGAGEANYVKPHLAVYPDTTHNLERSYYNNDRLSEDYVRSHLWRIRDAYQIWKAE